MIHQAIISTTRSLSKKVLSRKTLGPTSVFSKQYGSTSDSTSVSTRKLKQDPNNYRVPLRMPTMNDLMEPYGDYNTAYAAEVRKGNFRLVRGFVCLVSALTLLFYSGVTDELWMPNLDNIIADTEHLKYKPETEGRVTPYNLDADDDEAENENDSESDE